MKTLNHNLSAGDVVLLTAQLLDTNATFQYTQTGIVATTVKIQVSIRTSESMPWILVNDATLTIDPAKASDYIQLADYGYEYVEFKMVTGGVTVGSIGLVGITKARII